VPRSDIDIGINLSHLPFQTTHAQIAFHRSRLSARSVATYRVPTAAHGRVAETARWCPVVARFTVHEHVAWGD
jgi:hypothetical protein